MALTMALARKPLLICAATLTSLLTMFYASKSTGCLDGAAQDQPRKTLSIPDTMLRPKQLTVTNVQQLSHDMKKITFALPGGSDEISGVAPGDAIMTQHTPEGAWFPVLRPYTPIHDVDGRGILELLVKKYPNGRASTFMHNLTPGQQLKVWGPKPGPRLVPEAQHDILLIAGGAGIAPIFSLAKGILQSSEDKTRIQLLWGVRSTQDVVLRKELDALETRYPGRLRVTYAISRPEVDLCASNSDDDGRNFRSGRVDRDLVREALGRCDVDGWAEKPGCNVYICGPSKMLEALAGRRGILAEFNITKKQIYRF